MLSARFPRILGDMGSAGARPFPVLHSVVARGHARARRRRVGVVTISAATLTPAHLVAADASPDTPVVGVDSAGELFAS